MSTSNKTVWLFVLVRSAMMSSSNSMKWSTYRIESSIPTIWNLYINKLSFLINQKLSYQYWMSYCIDQSFKSPNCPKSNHFQPWQEYDKVEKSFHLILNLQRCKEIGWVHLNISTTSHTNLLIIEVNVPMIMGLCWWHKY